MKDQLNRSIDLKKIPKRIVSLVPSQTELLYDLGLGSSILGITKFCVHPTHFKKEKTIVGGTKDVHFDRIKALKPDLILCNKEENTLEMIQELETIAPVHISDVSTIADCLELIGMYGQIFSKEKEASKIVKKIKLNHEEFKVFLEDAPILKTAYFIWKKPWMVAAKDTFINELLELNKFINYYGHLKRYPEVKLSEEHPESAELVLLSSEPFPFKEKHRIILKTFFPQARVMIVDGEAFSWYGSRLLNAFDYFKAMHQDLVKPNF